MSSRATDRQARLTAAGPNRGGANRLVVATVVAVLVIAAVVAAVVIGSQSRRADTTAGGAALPAHASAMGAGILANPGAPADAPTLDLYADFQCPVCARFEQVFGEQITGLAEQNRVRLVVHTLSFLDDNLGNDSSNRAANAAACADDQDRFLPFYRATFAGQPPREGDGYTDAQLKHFAEQAGITGGALGEWEQCYEDRAHNQYVESVQTQSEKDGVNGTPTVRLDGKDLPLNTLTPQSLDDTVKAATK
ncbi:MAG: DsbA family protein [Actinomycetota bacterium]|nr:DsbA family protein [Actinomycetota bacterium]